MSAVLTAPSQPAAAVDPIRVMVVDDSVVVRGLVTRWLEQEPDLTVVASLRTGREAVDQVERVNPDVVILDIEMPELDGLSALPLLLAKKRDLVVIMASSLTRRQAEVSLRALALGATDYIPKPDSNHGITTSPAFRIELIDKIRHIGGRRKRRTGTVARPAAQVSTAGRAAPAHDTPSAPPPAWSLRSHPGRLAPRALLIGASTGGPQALTKLIGALGPVFDRAPVLIVQHMPPTFTTILAEHLTRAAGRPVREAEGGEAVVAGSIHLAPGARHMVLERRDNHPVIRLDDGAPVNFCKPAVDPLFHSAVPIWQGATLAVILTGMGHDGTDGARAIAAAGGSILAQDEATSVVWGMPGSAAQAGICSAVLPIDQIAPKIVRVFSGEQP
jgi:two-component system, chemotaxis family, protein-glutamate methylesterase/glutaminase